MKTKRRSRFPKKEDVTPDRSTAENKGRTSSLKAWWFRLETELKGLDFEIQEFVCQACSAYLRGKGVDVRRERQERRQWLKRVLRQMDRSGAQCKALRGALQSVPDAIRRAHRPEVLKVPLLEFIGLRGPAEYFRVHGLVDPATQIERLLQALTETDTFLTKEAKWMRDKIPRVRALWKARPIYWWQSGGFEYVLERLLREQANLEVKKAHHLIIEIRCKLDGKRLAFDTEKGYSPAIRQSIKRMPSDYKKECDKALKSRFNLPTRH